VRFTGFLHSTKYGRTIKVGNKDKESEIIDRKKQRKIKKDKMG
jgi:hypothetical protein